MITAWKVCRVVGGRLRASWVRYSFDGPVVRGPAPYVASRHEEILLDPVGAVREHGEQWTVQHARQPRFSERANGDPDPLYGFFAFATREQAECYAQLTSWPLIPDAHAIVEVDLFGRVVEHERGYRAQALRFVRIHIPEELVDQRETLETLYDCEVTSWLTSEKKYESTRTSLPTNPCPPSALLNRGLLWNPWTPPRPRRRERIVNWFRRNPHVVHGAVGGAVGSAITWLVLS